ncbi:MAG: hypothetical protein JO161_10020 [Planctomycetaceae bacterium]|nr:hypothetical protein [Planctomycetaceae bacterium]
MVIRFLTPGRVGQGSIFSEHPGGTMAEFFELFVEREDGRKGLQYINIEAISYVDLEIDAAGATSGETRVYLNNGYWFTVTGTKAAEVLSLINERGRAHFKEGTGDS